MTIGSQIIPVRLLLRRSVRYLLVSRGFRLVEAVVVLAALGFVLTGSRIAAIDRLGNRADIVATIIVTALSIALLRAVNRRVRLAIDRRFFREAYDGQVILTDLGEAVRTFTRSEQLVEFVATRITDALHPENVTIFLEDEATGELVSAFSSNQYSDGVSGEDSPPALVLPRDRMLAGRLVELPPQKAMETQGAALTGMTAAGSRDAQLVRERWTLRAISPALLIPVASNGHLYGVISLGRRLGDLPYSKEDKQLLLVVAGQMSAAVENASLIRRMAEEERIKRELEMAAEVQRRLLPAGALEDAAVELYGTCLPARWVGGDYYDYFVVGERRLGITIADVAGKGIAAALLMATVQALLRSQMTSEDRRLTDVVSSMSRLLRRSAGQGGYVTFFLAEFDEETRGLTYVNAGHNPPMLFRREAARKEEARFRPLTAGGPVIGTFLDVPYEQETIPAESGDVLVAYTDGATEALSPDGLEFGEERLRAVIAQSLHLTARELAERIIARVREWQGRAPQHDDITLVVAKVR